MLEEVIAHNPDQVSSIMAVSHSYCGGREGRGRGPCSGAWGSWLMWVRGVEFLPAYRSDG